MTRIWIISPGMDREATMGMLPGVNYFRVRMVRGGPPVPVRTAVIEPRDENGDLTGDVKYEVVIDGKEIPFTQWEHRSLLGDQISESDYYHMLEDGKFLALRGVDKLKAVDLNKLPPITP